MIEYRRARRKHGNYTIRGVLDEKQFAGLAYLWKQWREEIGEEFHREAWNDYMVVQIASERYLPLIAFTKDDIAVGMVECSWMIDPFTGLKTGYGDHAYVLRSYRKMNLFAGLVSAMSDVAKLWECEAECLPVAMDTQYLIPLYEGYGFNQSGIIMRRNHE